MKFVYDACAIVAVLNNERGAELVDRLLNDSAASHILHNITLGEIHGILLKKNLLSVIQPEQYWASNTPLLHSHLMDEAFGKRLGELKYRFRLSLGDAIVVATAERLQATIITADHPDFEPIATAGVCPVMFIRHHDR